MATWATPPPAAQPAAPAPVLCFICHGRNYADNTAEYFMRLFEADADDVDGDTKVAQLLSTILGRLLTPDTVHSALLCRPCAQICDEYEQLLARLEALRGTIVDNYNATIEAYCLAAEAEAANGDSGEEQQQQQQMVVAAVAEQETHPDKMIKLPTTTYTINGQRVVFAVPPDALQMGGAGAAGKLVATSVTSIHIDPLSSASQPIFLRDGRNFLCQLCQPELGSQPPPVPRFYTSAQLVAHLRSVHKERVYICEVCGCDYRQREELQQHRCELLDELPAAEAEAEAEVATVAQRRTRSQKSAAEQEVEEQAEADDMNDALCAAVDADDFCDDIIEELHAEEQQPTAADSIDTTAAVAVASTASPFACTVCPHVAASLSALRTHKRSHYASTRKSYACTSCPKRFHSLALLQEHANVHTGDRPHKCTDCDRDFASKYTLKAHQKIHTERGRRYACDECPKCFYTQQNLDKHQLTHSGVREHLCTECGKTFTTAHNLEVHRLVHSGERPFKCTECSKTFARRAEIRNHERTHTGERPFGCEVCGAMFAQRSNLMTHKRTTHLNDKRYKCADCEKSFKRRRLLDYHIKASHTGERPFACETCGATFVYPEHFKKHLRIHSGVKPFECEVCGKRFNSRDNRNAHRFVHSDKKPYECLSCGQGFMRKPLLLEHMKAWKHESKRIVVNRPRIMGKVVVGESEEVGGEEGDGGEQLEQQVLEMEEVEDVVVEEEEEEEEEDDERIGEEDDMGELKIAIEEVDEVAQEHRVKDEELDEDNVVIVDGNSVAFQDIIEEEHVDMV